MSGKNDLRYKQDIQKADADYQKVDPKHGALSLPRMFRHGAAAKDRSLAIDAAKERLHASKQGMVSKQDYDESRFEAAKSKAAIAAKSRGEADQQDHAGILHKIGSHIAEHPLPYLATAAGIAAIAAMQKRKQRLPEPSKY